MLKTTSIFASGLLLCGAGLLPPAPALGIEVNGGVRGETAWNSNVFSTAEDEEDDVSFRATPWVRLQDPRGDVTWSFEYRPAYEFFVDQSDLDGWDHAVSGAASWRIRPDTTVSIEDRFDRFVSVTRFNETVIDDAGQAISETQGRLNRFKRNRIFAEIEHLLSPTQAIFATVGHELYDPSDELAFDRENASVTAGYRHSISERNVVGAFLSWRRQSFESSRVSGERETDYYNLSFTWSHRFDPTFTIRASAGPAYVDPGGVPAGLEDLQIEARRFPGAVALNLPGDDDPVQLLDPSTCPTLDDGTPYLGVGCEPLPASGGAVVLRDSQVVTLANQIDEAEVSSDVNFFADVSLEKAWENWALRASYRRQEDAAGGANFSAIADIVSGTLTWTPSPRWRFTLSGSWLRQTQSTESLVPVVALRSGRVQDAEFLVTIAGQPFFFALPPLDAAEAFAVRGLAIDNEFEQTQITVGFNANYRLTRRISLFGSLLYVDVERERSFGATTGYDRFRAAVGVSYEFEPIRL